MSDITARMTDSERDIHKVAKAARAAERAKWEAEIERKETEIVELRQSLAQASDDALRLREAYARNCATLRIVTLAEALTDLLDWAENTEGEGRLCRIEALAKARNALDA